jgi:hypothetical protein
MADNLEELNKRTGDLQGLLVPGTSVQENTDAYKKIEQRIVTESEQKFSGRPANDSEKQAYIAKRKYELTIEYIATVTSVFLEKYKAENVGKAKVDAVADFLKKQPEIAKDLATQLFAIMKHGAESQQDIYGKALAKYQDDYWKKMADIIDRGVNAIISPHEAKVEMANLGIKFGMIMSGLGAMFGKDEWVETGSALATQGEKLATKEGEKILALTKTLRDEYVKLGKDWQAPDFTNGLDRLPLNYTGAGQEVFKGWREGSGFSALQKTIKQMNDLSGGKLLEDPVIRQHSFGNGGNRPVSMSNILFENPKHEHVWYALLKQESGFDFAQYTMTGYSPSQMETYMARKSPKDALGLGQMIQGTARAAADRLGISFNWDEYKQNPDMQLALSKEEFRHLLGRYNGNVVLALAGYNAGPGNVDKWIEKFGDPRSGKISDQDFARQIPFDETRNYVASVSNILAKNAKEYEAITTAGQKANVAIADAKATVKPEFNQNAPRIAGGGTGRSPDIDVVFLEEQKPGSKPADKGSFEHLARIDPLKLTLEM